MHLAPTPEPILSLDPDDLDAGYARLGLADLSDEQCFELAAAAVAVPSRDGANSFILHAPLELLARRALLAHVPPARRDPIRRRMLWVATTYEHAADPVVPRVKVPRVAGRGTRRTRRRYRRRRPRRRRRCLLLARPARLDRRHPGRRGTHGRRARCRGSREHLLLPSRPAHGHEPRRARIAPAARRRARPRAAAAHRMDQERRRHAGTDPELFARSLACTPRLGLPGSDFVYPIVHQVDRDEYARAVVEPTLPADAAASGASNDTVAGPVDDPGRPASAPYGWTHCLTLPQSVLGILPWLPRPATATAIAATYVVAFRAALGDATSISRTSRNTSPRRCTTRSRVIPGPRRAPCSTHPRNSSPQSVPSSPRGGTHEDAHVAKYTAARLSTRLPSIHAPRNLYLAAAAFLHAWWARN